LSIGSGNRNFFVETDRYWTFLTARKSKITIFVFNGKKCPRLKDCKLTSFGLNLKSISGNNHNAQIAMCNSAVAQFRGHDGMKHMPL
jgi:hypothetical protein